MVNKKKQGGVKKEDKPLYALSAYARGYLTADERVKGVMLSAYTGSGDDREYVNVWVMGDFVSVVESKDGNVIVKIKMLGIDWIDNTVAKK